jgi:hypothetical protein
MSELLAYRSSLPTSEVLSTILAEAGRGGEKYYEKISVIAEAVSRWLPTAAARVRARVWQVGFVVDKVASEQVFSEYFGFPCQNHSFHQLLHHHHNSKI